MTLCPVDKLCSTWPSKGRTARAHSSFLNIRQILMLGNDTNIHVILTYFSRLQNSFHSVFVCSYSIFSLGPSTTRTQEGQTALQLAISNQLPLVVDAICTRGADMSVVDDKGDPPLWLALENGLEDIASTLVRMHRQTG